MNADEFLKTRKEEKEKAFSFPVGVVWLFFKLLSLLLRLQLRKFEREKEMGGMDAEEGVHNFSIAMKLLSL